jgi:hypothetical protein
MRRLLAAGFVVVLAACAREAPPGRPGERWHLERLEAEPETLTVGDPVRIRLSGVLPDSLRPLGDLAERLPPELALRRPPRLRRRRLGDGLTRWRWDLELAPFATGTLKVGPLAVAVASERETLRVLTDSLWLPVRSVLPESVALADLRDIKPPVGLGRFPWLLAGAGLALAALVLFLLTRRRAREETAGEPALAPHEEFLRLLRQLEADGLPERGQWKAFALRLTWILRRYLERTTGARVLEMTTREIQAWLPETGWPERLRQVLLEELRFWDGIKFAGRIPTLGECGRSVERIRGLVGELERRRSAAAVPEEVGA